MWFFNPSLWVRHHLFKDASIWEIPLVKPRFGCSLDLSLALRGYDMGLALRKTLDHFKGTPTTNGLRQTILFLFWVCVCVFFFRLAVYRQGLEVVVGGVRLFRRYHNSARETETTAV